MHSHAGAWERVKIYLEFGLNDPSCQMGAAFNDYAYSVVDVDYTTSYQVFAHESGHQLGMNHDEVAPGTVTAYSYAFGYAKTNTNQTVLAVQSLNGSCNCPRSLQYSNPYINFLGTSTPSGDSSSRNARVGALLAPYAAEFRGASYSPPAGQIFENGFELIRIPQ